MSEAIVIEQGPMQVVGPVLQSVAADLGHHRNLVSWAQHRVDHAVVVRHELQ